MNVGLFGGSFDPSIADMWPWRKRPPSVSPAAVLFVPATCRLITETARTCFVHRYAMVALATQDEKQFVPSLLEAPAELRSAGTAKGPSLLRRTIRWIQFDDSSRR